MPLFKSHNSPPPPPPPQQSPPPNRSRSLFSRNRDPSPDNYSYQDHSYDDNTSHGHGGGFLSRRRSSSSTSPSGRGTSDPRNDPTIRGARQKVADAETSEREADRALGLARAAVREAREHVKILEREALEE